MEASKCVIYIYSIGIFGISLRFVISFFKHLAVGRSVYLKQPKLHYSLWDVILIQRFTSHITPSRSGVCTVLHLRQFLVSLSAYLGTSALSLSQLAFTRLESYSSSFAYLPLALSQRYALKIDSSRRQFCQDQLFIARYPLQPPCHRHDLLIYFDYSFL